IVRPGIGWLRHRIHWSGPAAIGSGCGTLAPPRNGFCGAGSASADIEGRDGAAAGASVPLLAPKRPPKLRPWAWVAWLAACVALSASVATASRFRFISWATPLRTMVTLAVADEYSVCSTSLERSTSL